MPTCRRGNKRAVARWRRAAAPAALRAARCDAAESALWRAHRHRRRQRGHNARERMGRVQRAGRETAQTDDGVDFFAQLASALEAPLRRLAGLDAHARPQAAGQDAPEGIAPRAIMEQAPSNAGCPLRPGGWIGARVPAAGRCRGADAARAAPAGTGPGGGRARAVVLDTNIVLDLFIFADQPWPRCAARCRRGACTGFHPVHAR